MQINAANLLIAAQQQQAARPALQQSKEFAPLDFKQTALASKPVPQQQPGSIQRPGANLDIRV